jgi:DNA processing protein
MALTTVDVRTDPSAVAVALSCLRLGPDAKAARLLWDMLAGRAPDGDDCLFRLAERLEGAEDACHALVAKARVRARAALARAAAGNLSLLPYFAPGYPAALHTIADPPIVLWATGDPSTFHPDTVAIVGSRRATPAGLDIARRLAADLAAEGLVVVSGMARGVDAAAHVGALEGGGRTVAVLGCGVDVVYPPEHAALAARIRNSGIVISELPPGMPPYAHHFPLRNRIISGLARAVVVIEASDKSGSLITARAALDQNRDVLAVPGSVGSGRSKGCHALIKDGAHLVETVEDILQELKWPEKNSRVVKRRNSLDLSELERTMDAGEPYSVDDLASRTGRLTSDLLAELGALELLGRVARMEGGRFVRLDGPAIDR